MPYRWIETERPDTLREMHLWPHQSLPPRGFVLFIGVTFFLLLIPLFPLLGTTILWGLLPFLLLALAGTWFAIHQNRQNAQVLEILTLSEQNAHLVRHDSHGQVQEWDCNRYWAKPQMHEKDGPVPYYVTLKGAGREVEIGAFLSEDERVALFDELTRTFNR